MVTLKEKELDGAISGSKMVSRASRIAWLVALFILFAVIAFFCYLMFYFMHEYALLRQRAYLWSDPVVHRIALMILYVLFFMFSMAAFVLMATREYLQDLMSLSEKQLIFAGWVSEAEMWRHWEETERIRERYPPPDSDVGDAPASI